MFPSKEPSIAEAVGLYNTPKERRISVLECQHFNQKALLIDFTVDGCTIQTVASDATTLSTNSMNAWVDIICRSLTSEEFGIVPDSRERDQIRAILHTRREYLESQNTI